MVKNKAFTMIEILVVLGIIGFLMAFIGPRVMRYRDKSEIFQLKLKMSQVKDSLLEYKQDMGHYPLKREGGIQALLYKPTTPGSDKWDGKYLSSEDDISDGDGNVFELNIPPVQSKDFKRFEIIAPHPSGEEDKDIIVGA